jgi:hypothetical protein
VLRREFLGDKRRVYDAALAILLFAPEPPPAAIFDLMENSRARVLQDRVLRPGTPHRLQDVQARLEPGSVLLEFWATDSGGAVLFVTRSEAALRKLPPVDWAGLREAARERSGDWRARAAAIGRTLLADIPPLRGPELRSVIVVPDGTLALAPFELLQIPGDDRTLVERAPVFYLPSAGLLLRDPAGRRGWAPPWRRELLALAAPAVPISSGAGPLGALAGDPAAWAPLPMAGEEARAIAGLLPGRSDLHLGADALKRYLMIPSAPFPLIHVATHAVSDSIDPERSRILFAAERPREGADYLFLREIYGLKLHGLDLVTLSACDTETGKLTGGEGVEGFAKPFLAAGARATVTTLWPVEDHATAEFMKQFYAGLAAGISKAEALRQAKLRFLRSGSRLSEPQYWAAFVLNGDGLAPIPRSFGWPGIGLAAGVAVLAALAAVRIARSRRPRSAFTVSRR